MNCETNDCRKEKRGCKGCYYDDYFDKADKIFKKLGYEKEERNKADVYIKHCKYITRQIGFNNETKNIMLDVHFITIEELQAINKKIQELGW